MQCLQLLFWWSAFYCSLAPSQRPATHPFSSGTWQIAIVATQSHMDCFKLIFAAGCLPARWPDANGVRPTHSTADRGNLTCRERPTTHPLGSGISHASHFAVASSQARKRTNARMHACMHACMHVCTDVCTDACACACGRAFMWACIHARVETRGIARVGARRSCMRAGVWYRTRTCMRSRFYACVIVCSRASLLMLRLMPLLRMAPAAVAWPAACGVAACSGGLGFGGRSNLQ